RLAPANLVEVRRKPRSWMHHATAICNRGISASSASPGATTPASSAPRPCTPWPSPATSPTASASRPLSIPCPRWPTPSTPAPADDTVFAATWSMDLHHAFVNDLAEALLAQGLEVEAYYPESGPGQQEMSIRHAPALAAADRQIVFRETVRAVAVRHGLRAS